MLLITQTEALWVVTPFSLIDLADIHKIMIQNTKIWIAFGMFAIAVRKNSIAVVWIKEKVIQSGVHIFRFMILHTTLSYDHLLEINIYCYEVIHTIDRYHTVWT